jgi:hypothetical protein
MLTRSLLSLVLVAAWLGVARPAQASVNIGLGADWIEGGGNDFNLTLGADSLLLRSLSLGGRAGVAFFDDAHHVGVPIDLRLKLHVQRIYFEGLVGPWILFDAADHVHLHGAFGFGLEAGALSVGLEVGKLSRATLIGVRLAFRL